MARRVVITSIGVISSLGYNADAILNNLKKENVSFRRPDFDDEVVTSPIGGFSVRDFIGRFKNSRYLSRGACFSVASAIEAVRHAGLDGAMLARSGLFVGTGPNLDISGEFPGFQEGKMDADDLAALWILRFLPNTAASAVAQIAGIHGESSTITTACAASLQAIGEAFRKIKDGYLDLAFAGGGDSRLSPGGILAYKKAQALYTGAGEPEQACRPFDKGRQGFVPGEGGAFFLLEELEHAKRRGACMHGEVCGFGASLDGETMTAPASDGKWAEKAIRSALQEARVPPSDVHLVSAHGTGTALNDEMEAVLIDRIYGTHKPLVIALKSWIGHTAAACGAVELAVALISAGSGYLPKIRNLREPCMSGIHFVREGTTFTPGVSIIQNFGFGGQNCALVIKPWKE